ncbi:hypothetical protein KIL84_016435 [Mauremys mutica]|uniref:Uncharacterized protein n=1 Tax=Mauremys mutica TaxID=74926 RepID=A0A9D3X3D9_9SAUR|nr:hypothetical protein KIL84_016435 [Mauremys mutica]
MLPGEGGRAGIREPTQRAKPGGFKTSHCIAPRRSDRPGQAAQRPRVGKGGSQEKSSALGAAGRRGEAARSSRLPSSWERGARRGVSQSRRKEAEGEKLREQRRQKEGGGTSHTPSSH